MATFLLCQGIEPVEIEESYNTARNRLNKAKLSVIQMENGNIEENAFKPFHDLSFKTTEGGRISISPDKVIGVGSDEPKDVGSGDE